MPWLISDGLFEFSSGEDVIIISLLSLENEVAFYNWSHKQSLAIFVTIDTIPILKSEANPCSSFTMA